MEQHFNSILYTYTGKKFGIPHPSCSDICLKDIAHSLSRLCRFNGHCSFFYNVAQHSLNTAKIIKSQGYPAGIQLYAVLHDAAEAYVCDMPKPLKELLPEYKNIENEIQAVIWNALGIPVPTAEALSAVKKADEILLEYEIRYMMRNTARGQQPSEAENSVGAMLFRTIRLQLYTSFMPRWYTELRFIRKVRKLIKQTERRNVT